MKFKPLDLGRIRTYPLRERENKVRSEKFAKVWQKGGPFGSFGESLPHILVGEDFRAVVSAIVAAAKLKKPFIICYGSAPGQMWAESASRGLDATWHCLLRGDAWSGSGSRF